MIAASKIGCALPVAAAITPVNVERTVHKLMGFKWHYEVPKLCKTCVSLFGNLVLAQTVGFTGFLA
jgi:hypothetical protein